MKILENAIQDKDIVVHSLVQLIQNSNKRFMQGYSRIFVQSAHLFDLCAQKVLNNLLIFWWKRFMEIQEEQPIKRIKFSESINHYGSVKLCIETVLKTFNKQSHSNMIIARISNPYGPGQDFNKGVGFIDAALKRH